MIAGIGHNQGPSLERGQKWRAFQWQKAREAAMPSAIPLMVVKMRVARARELGLDYKAYAAIRQATGRDILALLFSSNALRVFRAGAPHIPLREAEVLEGFAKGAPRHHHLVVKAHPLEDGRAPLRRVVKQVARDLGVADRVHFVRGGKLAQLLNDARTAVTVNSTAGQQVLWRGIPLKVFGSAVYAKPEFVSDQPLAQFFAAASRPDNKAYKDYRRYLLETSQVPGGFYAARARTQLMRQVVDMMLAPEDPYDALELGTAAPRQQLRAVT